MPRRFQWVLGVVIAVAGLCNASPASAARPVITQSVDEGTITNIQDCGTAHVDITFRDEITTRAFYDDGVLVKVVRSHRGLGPCSWSTTRPVLCSQRKPDRARAPRPSILWR